MEILALSEDGTNKEMDKIWNENP